MHKRIKLFFFLITCLIFCNSLFASKKFISIGDIHFNPFLDCKPNEIPCPLAKKLQSDDYQNWEQIFRQFTGAQVSNYRQNTNFALFESTLSMIEKVTKQEHPQFLLMLGDFFAHDIKSNYQKFSGDHTQAGYAAFIKKTMQFLTYRIKKISSSIDMYLVVGNNDSYSDDYGIVPNGPFFKDVSNIWGEMIKDRHNRKAFLRNFPASGYYSILVPKTHHRVIILNTVLFTMYPNPTGQDNKKAADKQLKWLDHQLQLAEQHHEQVMLAFHIPVGIDVFMTAKNRSEVISTFWQENYAQKFKTILNKHLAVLIGMHSGHIHKDGFQILKLNKNKEILVMYTPSISPIYRNNPGFKVYEYDDYSFKLKNYDAYYIDLNEKNPFWKKEYNFNKTYQPKCTRCDLLKGLKNVALPGYIKNKYMVNVHFDELTEGNINYYQCAISYFISSDYKNCLKEKKGA